jgi:hypothetical protein
VDLTHWKQREETCLEVSEHILRSYHECGTVRNSVDICVK